MSMFRESPSPDGKPGPVSARRVLAVFFAVAGVALAVVGAVRGIDWQGIAALFGIPVAAVLFLMFFTTWGDVADAIKKVKG